MRSFACYILITIVLARGNQPVRSTDYPTTGASPKQIPVLCYHHVKPPTHLNSPAYTIDPVLFEAQVKLLADSGYQSILPDDLYNYLTGGSVLPERSVMITFDDSHAEHFSTVAPVLEKYNWRGVFFVMTVTTGKTGYLSPDQIKSLSGRGHVIASHSWDHPRLDTPAQQDWQRQISGPKNFLEKITGKPVLYFAYPYGAWNQAAIAQLKGRGIKAAFQLSGSMSATEPLYTIRRLMVQGNWPAATLYHKIRTTFD